MRNQYTVGSLFSGIGGFELGLEMTGRFKTLWQCEVDPYCRSVLQKHWPDAEMFCDVRTLGNPDVISPVDIIVGGFPCQDLSMARHGNNGKGLKGEKSGLYVEFIRIIREQKPRGFIIENVPSLVDRGLFTILREIAAFGYDAEWHVVSASAVGAPHKRNRLFVMGYANGTHCQGSGLSVRVHEKQSNIDCPGDTKPCEAWAAEPDVSRVVDGIPDWTHRVKALGNAVVPKVSECIGQRMSSILDGTAVDLRETGWLF
tara:strand:+ start:17098 stop:17871 length:774 start_codon:yes stop_codon:yes gene_type:complete